MDIDIKHWFFITSACVLGWLCGFIVYSVILLKVQPVAPVNYPRQQTQILHRYMADAYISHAVVRITKPHQESQPTASTSILPYKRHIAGASRSFFL